MSHPGLGARALRALCGLVLALWGGVTMAQTADTRRFELRIEAPEAFRGLLQKHLNIQRFQAVADLDVPELQRLVDQLPADARQLMGTQGHFAATATATLETTPTTPSPTETTPAANQTGRISASPSAGAIWRRSIGGRARVG